MTTITISGINLTSEKIRRIFQAIEETERQIAREMKYSEEFRNHNAISAWKAHLEKLQAMLQ